MQTRRQNVAAELACHRLRVSCARRHRSRVRFSVPRACHLVRRAARSRPSSADFGSFSPGRTRIRCAIPGRPVLPAGGQHRYVITADNEPDRALPVLAYHVSQLRPFELATEVQ